MKKRIVMLATVFHLSGCAHHNDVAAGVDGTHRVQLFTDDRQAGRQAALKQASHYCQQQDKSAYTVNVDIQYLGSESEQDYETQKAIAGVAEAAGAVMWVYGKNRVDDVGATMALGGAIADDALGKPYQVELDFRCR